MSIKSRVALGGTAVVVIVAALVWLVFYHFTPADYVAMAPALERISVWMLHVGAIGQTAFVLLWVTLPWFREWIGRALMVKSLALMIFLDSALVHYHIDPYPAEQLVGVILFGLVVLGILSQVVALGFEMWRARKQKRRVMGTAEH